MYTESPTVWSNTIMQSNALIEHILRDACIDSNSQYTCQWASVLYIKEEHDNIPMLALHRWFDGTQ